VKSKAIYFSLTLLNSASLKQVKLRGIYATLTPDVPHLWRCVLFVREGESCGEVLAKCTLTQLGPYQGAVLRFRVFFPDGYPFELPVVTFDRHINHPLIMSEQAIQSDDVFTDRGPEDISRSGRLVGTLNLEPGFRESFAADEQKAPKVNVIDIFLYVRSCFTDVQTLDGLRDHDIFNLEAWSAWKAHKARTEDDDINERAKMWRQHIDYLVRQNIENEALFDYALNSRPISA